MHVFRLAGIYGPGRSALDITSRVSLQVFGYAPVFQGAFHVGDQLDLSKTVLILHLRALRQARAMCHLCSLCFGAKSFINFIGTS